MPTPTEPLSRLDLRSLDLVSGAAGHVQAPVPVADLVMGGQTYRVDPPAPIARVDVSLASSGRLFRLRTQAEVVGPCWRCLEEARVPVTVDAREYAAANRPPDAEFDDDLDSVYLDGPILDVATWARDALVGELPPSILCRPDCRGLCPTCGADLNAGSCDCPPPPPDDRWAALGPLAERLRREG